MSISRSRQKYLPTGAFPRMIDIQLSGSNRCMRQIHMIRSRLVVAIMLVVLGIDSSISILRALERPNVIVFLTDDQGWGDLSINGNTNLSTPNIDSIGRNGARFDRFYVCPVCSPTRAEFLTGRYHPRGGVYSTSTGGERLDLDERTIAELFSAAGYRTAAFGKWHNGSQYPYHPNARGFAEYYGFTSGHWGDYFSPPLEHNGRTVKGNGFTTDDFTDRALRFIENHRDENFFVYLPYNTPHSPMQVPDRWWDNFKNRPISLRATQSNREDVNMTRAALAMVENVDWNVGRVLQKLEQLKLAEDTIVVFFCDNGPNSDRWNGGMKGRKGSTDEGGVRSPLLIRYPAAIERGRLIAQISGAIDLLPTLADLAGISTVGTKPLDGQSLKPLLTGQTGALPERTLFTHWNGKVSARTQQFRLDDSGRLYDMVADPSQLRDVSGKHPEIAQELQSAVERWKVELLSGLRNDKRPFPLGHSDYHWTPLPARDGRAHGGLKRSDTAPNCSYFTNWKSLDDKVTWPVEVGVSDTYLVELHYTCPPADVGAEVEVSLNSSKIVGTIMVPHNPPATGAEHDRVPRKSESLMKDFKVMKLGKIKLEAGQGELTLRALSMPGSQVMEFRMLTFQRVSPE